MANKLGSNMQTALPFEAGYKSNMNESLLEIVNKRQLVSVMNKTKWRELCGEFENLKNLSVKVRYKLITTEQIFGFSPVWWHELFEETKFIEWLEFDPIITTDRGLLLSPKEIDISSEIVNVLQKHPIRYSKEQSCIKVWGYISSATCPDFV